MNLMAGLLRPTRGEISVLGIPPDQPERLCRILGYCTQFDAYPKGLTGWQFLYSFLLLHGMSEAECRRRAAAALERVNMMEAAHRPVAAYSKGMRQRIKLAQAMAHDPQVLVLDEPLNGLDPMARAETIALFREWGRPGPPRDRLQPHPARGGPHLRPGDPAEPRLRGGGGPDPGRAQRGEGAAHADPGALRPPAELAARLFQQNHVVEARIQGDGRNLLLRTNDADGLYLLLNRVILEAGLEVESVAPADDDVNSVYQYLIGGEGGPCERARIGRVWPRQTRARCCAWNGKRRWFRSAAGGSIAWRWGRWC